MTASPSKTGGPSKMQIGKSTLSIKASTEEELFRNENFEEEDQIDESEIEDLFSKNTASFRCLAQILISRSSLLRNPLYHFPPLVDPGIDDAFNYKEPEPLPDNVGIDVYKKQCKDFGIVPISRVIKSLPTDTLNLRYYGLTEKQVRAIMEALKNNTFVSELILQDNWLTPRGVQAISEMLNQNHTIRYINLSECRIKSEGAWILSLGLTNTISLKELDVSFNGLEDTGFEALASGLEDNSSISVINLSHNNLGEESAIILATVLLRNDTIEELDVSWNNFCTAKGNKTLFEALKLNTTIKSLNLAWNGIGSKETVTPIMKFLKKSKVLEHIDLSSNRLTGNPLMSIYRGLQKCKTLIRISIGSNPLTPEEADLLVTLFTGSAKCALRYLDMDNVFVSKEFVPTWKRLTARGKSIQIGGILSNYTIYGPDINKLLFRRAKFVAMKPKKKKAQRDFGHFILQMPEKPMVKQDFETLVKKFKMKTVFKDPALITLLTNQFPAKKQKIDLNAMRESYMGYFPDTALPPPKKKKGKKSKKKVVLDAEPQVDEFGNPIEKVPTTTSLRVQASKLVADTQEAPPDGTDIETGTPIPTDENGEPQIAGEQPLEGEGGQLTSIEEGAKEEEENKGPAEM